jgi:hypothetical protein
MSFSTSTIGVFTGAGTSYRSVANALTRVFCGIRVTQLSLSSIHFRIRNQLQYNQIKQETHTISMRVNTNRTDVHIPLMYTNKNVDIQFSAHNVCLE